MLTATENEARDTPPSIEAGAAMKFSVTPQAAARVESPVQLSEWATRLVTLLEEDPVDLARVSDQIRSQPELADTMRRVAAYLQFAPEESVSSVEEAAIVMGTERLRALLHSWPAFQKRLRDRTEAREADGYRETVPGRTAELVDLAGFARLLGLGNYGLAAASPETAEISALLLRDFLALLPTTIKLQLVSGARQGGGR